MDSLVVTQLSTPKGEHDGGSKVFFSSFFIYFFLVSFLLIDINYSGISSANFFWKNANG